MTYMKSMVLIKTDRIGYGMKIAAQLKRMGINAAVRKNYNNIYNEKYRVILIDDETDESLDQMCDAQIIILTDKNDLGNHVTYKENVLYIPKTLKIYPICNLIKLYFKDNQISIEQSITIIMRKMGMSPKIKGYHFLRTAVICVLDNPELVYKITTELYDKIAKIYNTSKLSVERNLRTVIDNSYEKTPKQFRKFFPYIIGKPSNADVIALIADNVQIGIL